MKYLKTTLATDWEEGKSLSQRVLETVLFFVPKSNPGYESKLHLVKEWITGLSGKLKLGDFSGRGEGWFNNSEIEKFCVSLIQMFTTMEGKTELIGSEQNSDGSEYLETFALRVYVLSLIIDLQIL